MNSKEVSIVMVGVFLGILLTMVVSKPAALFIVSLIMLIKPAVDEEWWR